eukprot:451329-Pleurochrysis_carterae.AAC.1
MTDLNLSRELFELLRRLLSYLYHPPLADGETGRGDYYERRKMCASSSASHVWVNPYNQLISVSYSELQPRKTREAERLFIFGGCDAGGLASGLAAGRKNLV